MWNTSLAGCKAANARASPVSSRRAARACLQAELADGRGKSKRLPCGVVPSRCRCYRLTSSACTARSAVCWRSSRAISARSLVINRPTALDVS